jgi:signal transduction histidine kinase
VLVDYQTDALIVQVDDDGLAPTRQPDHADATDGGSGIAGMRARADALGGVLDAAPKSGGGFRVRAWLPIEATPEAGTADDGSEVAER